MRARPASDEPAAVPPSLISSGAQPRIKFVHPGYNDNVTTATFLSLPRLDDGGVCFDTALAACGIIACNKWSGFFSTDKLGQSRVDRPADGILRDHPYYYYQLPATPVGAASFSDVDPSLPYPIVVRFSDWSFPHDNLPAPWTQLQLQTNSAIPPMIVSQRPSSCVATNYSHGVDVAHCVPSGERGWWDANSMDAYGSALTFSTRPHDSPANLVPLRSDFHRVFDERQLCFAPKLVEEGSGSAHVQTRLLIHVVIPSPNGQVAGLWHNRALHALPPGLSKECLFARFAYTILSPAVFSSVFLSSTAVARHIRIRDPETQVLGAKMESPTSCRRILHAARSRSPKKRSVPPGDSENDGRAEELDGTEPGDDDSLDSHPDGLLAQFGPDPSRTTPSDEEEERGRTRKRSFALRDEEMDDVRRMRRRLGYEETT